MPAQWTGEIVGKMHINHITFEELSAKLSLHPKYVSSILNGRRCPKGAEGKFRKVLNELIEGKEKQHEQEKSIACVGTKNF